MTPSIKRARTTATEDPTRAFFEGLRERGHEPLLRNASGTLRFDLADGSDEHWYVRISKGDVSVSRRVAAADTVVRTQRSVFGDIVSGRSNAMAALLRGALASDGNPGLLVLFQRLFPGPPPSRAKARGRRDRREP